MNPSGDSPAMPSRSPRSTSLSDPLDPVVDLRPNPLPPVHGVGGWLGRLKVGQKIILGHTVVLGVVMIGITLGFAIADRYKQVAIAEEEDAIEELYQVYQLKNAVFRVRTQQHKLILYMAQPDLWEAKHTQLMALVADVRQEWVEFRATFRNPSRRLKDTPQEKAAYNQLMPTKNAFDDYLNQSEILFKASNPKNLSAAAIAARQSELFQLMHSPQIFTLDEFLDNIENLVRVTAAEYEHAKADLRQAEQLRLQIIIISLLLSAAIAMLLVLYMNRAITNPIQVVTRVAQQVTEEANFDLQAPVTTQDEIGILATSLNRLIQEVQELLKNQQATNEQLAVYSQILEKKVQERTQALQDTERSQQSRGVSFQSDAPAIATHQPVPTEIAHTDSHRSPEPPIPISPTTDEPGNTANADR